MQNNELKFDPLLNDKFFDLTRSEQDLTITVGFPLPASPDTLSTFFASDEGQSFKQAFEKIIKKLRDWAIKNKLNIDNNLQNFKETYKEYTGLDMEINKLWFPLYQLGIPALAKISELIEVETISLNFRTTLLNNLLTSINVCGPGAFVNIQNAYLSLQAHLNLAIHRMEFRKKMTEQGLLTIMNNINKSHPNIFNNLEIHYVAAVINHFRKTLAVKKVKDKNIACCQQTLISTLILNFKTASPCIITAKRYIEQIILELELENLPEKITQRFDALNEFEKNLNIYGLDENFFYRDDLIGIDDKTNAYYLSWKSQHTLFLNLFNRLCQSGYFNPLALEQKRFCITEESYINYYPDLSLKFAYVHIPNAKAGEKSYIPFVVYCIGLFALDESQQKALLFNFLPSTFPKSLEDLIRALTYYFQSREYEHNTRQEKLNITVAFMTILPKTHQLWKKVAKDVGNWVDDLETLIVFLQNLPTNCYSIFFETIGPETLGKIINNKQILIHVLNSVPLEHRLTLLNTLNLIIFLKIIKITSITINFDAPGQFADNTPHIDEHLWRITYEELLEFLESLIHLEESVNFLEKRNENCLFHSSIFFNLFVLYKSLSADDRVNFVSYFDPARAKSFTVLKMNFLGQALNFQPPFISEYYLKELNLQALRNLLNNSDELNRLMDFLKCKSCDTKYHNLLNYLDIDWISVPRSPAVRMNYINSEAPQPSFLGADFCITIAEEEDSLGDLLNNMVDAITVNDPITHLNYIDSDFVDLLNKVEDKTELMIELINIDKSDPAYYIRYTNTALTCILSQKFWLAELLLDEFKDSHKSQQENDALLQNLLNSELQAPSSDQASKIETQIKIISLLNCFFEKFLQKETTLINERSLLAGSTALHVAVFGLDHQAVHALVCAGADITLEDNLPILLNNKILIRASLAFRHFRDFYTIPGSQKLRNLNLYQLSPLESAFFLEDQWLVHYFLALYSEKTLNEIFAKNFQRNLDLKSAIESAFPGIFAWANHLKKDFIKMNTAEEPNLFKFPNKKLRLSPYNSCSVFNSKNKVQADDQNSKNIFRENKSINETVIINGVTTQIDHRKPSEEELRFIHYIKEQTDKKIGVMPYTSEPDLGSINLQPHQFN